MAHSRRSFLQKSSLALAAAAAGKAAAGKAATGRRVAAFSQDQGLDPGERPQQASGVTVLNPRNRVPLSFIIDDSTCLVNLAHFGIPQFAEVFPERYTQDWRRLPREIPDRFVLEFAGWCREQGVKGKYSVVPYPACVGWIDRGLAGWSAEELRRSLALIRETLTPDWDLHPEMISHTRVIDIATGRPYASPTPAYMENWDWSQTKSADELAAYIAYALRLLRNVDLPCEGMTTPGGFGSRNQANLAIATLEAVRDVYRAEIPHYFRDLFTDPDASVAPRVLYASGITGDDPQCVVSIIGCTGDWFGGWDGLEPGSADRFITEDGRSGRLVEVIARDEPAVLVCHWPGIYYNGDEVGFTIFKTVVERLHEHYDHLTWMKLSEIARYWAARELTSITSADAGFLLGAPYACPDFTLSVPRPAELRSVKCNGRPLARVNGREDLRTDTWLPEEDRVVACFDLYRGSNELTLTPS